MTSTDNHIAHPESHISSGGKWVSRSHNALSRLAKVLQLWSARAQQRGHLAKLSPEHLRDIGVTADVAHAEISKPLWQA
jgi:uncharacterized protein YjiS (DUF1127 family)